MAFKKGFSGNPNGRPAGSLNKSKLSLATFLNNNLKDLQGLYDGSQDSVKLDILLKVAKFIVPVPREEAESDPLAMLTPAQVEQVIAELRRQRIEEALEQSPN
jgi:hypothetical protein